MHIITCNFKPYSLLGRCLITSQDTFPIPSGFVPWAKMAVQSRPYLQYVCAHFLASFWCAPAYLPWVVAMYHTHREFQGLIPPALLQLLLAAGGLWPVAKPSVATEVQGVCSVLQRNTGACCLVQRNSACSASSKNLILSAMHKYTCSLETLGIFIEGFSLANLESLHFLMNT